MDAASASACSGVIQFSYRAISSRHAILSPCRSSMVSMNVAARNSDSGVPVSSHATPRPSSSKFNCPSLRYTWLMSVISNSPRAEGVNVRAISSTSLS